MPSSNKLIETERLTFQENARVTIKDVARAAKVSLGTVSRVINGQPNVGPESRRKVLEAIEQLGFVPNEIAQSMRTLSSRVIGFMVSDVANPMFARLVSASEEVLNSVGYNMILANSGDDPSRETAILALFQRRRLDGAIITISSDSSSESTQLLQGCGIPIVLIEREVKVDFDTVACDHFQGATRALDYLFSLRHRRIGLITSSAYALPGRDRIRAFTQAYARERIELDSNLLFAGGHSPDYGFSAGQSLLSRAARPTAVIVGVNQMAGLLMAARAMGVNVPADLSIISLGDTDLAQLHSPPITAVRWHPEIVGRTAAEILLSRLNGSTGQHLRRTVVLPTELIVRHSCIALN